MGRFCPLATCTTITYLSKNVKSITTKVNYPQKTILKLLKGRTYYFRVRSYRKYRGKKYYSAWSPVKTLKVKK